MPAVRKLISALNELARTRLPTDGRAWRGDAAADAGRGAAPARPTKPPDLILPELPEGEGAYAHAGTEPPLEEVLRDPIVQLVMQADGLEPAAVGRAPAPGVAATGPGPER